MSVTIGRQLPWIREQAKTTAYTLSAADSGSLMTTDGAGGAVKFTLPPLASVVAGFRVWFLNTVNQSMSVCAASDTGTIIADGNAAASTCSWQTSSHKIGSMCMAEPNPGLTAWVVINQGKTAVTVS